MKFIDLTIPFGIGTPAWPTYEPLQVKYFKRLAPNGANGQVVTHSNHVGTHLDGEIHFYTPGKDIASLEFDFLCGEAAIVDLSDCCGDYDVYTPEMIEERVNVLEGDILLIHTGYHHFGWDQPYGNEVRYMVMHPGPDARFDANTIAEYLDSVLESKEVNEIEELCREENATSDLYLAEIASSHQICRARSVPQKFLKIA